MITPLMSRLVASLWKLCLPILGKSGPTVITMTAAVVIYTHCAGTAYYAAGASLCGLSVKMIKRFIRQPRPTLYVRGKLKKSYGMPSTHSASITFLATYILLACLHLPVHPVFPAYIRLAPLIVVPYASAVMMSRVWLGHHTWLQVFAGGSYGIVFAIFWFEFWRRGLNDKLQLLEMDVNARIYRYL